MECSLLLPSSDPAALEEDGTSWISIRDLPPRLAQAPLLFHLDVALSHSSLRYHSSIAPLAHMSRSRNQTAIESEVRWIDGQTHGWFQGLSIVFSGEGRQACGTKEGERKWKWKWEFLASW